MKRLFLFVLIFWSVGTGVLLAASSEEDILSQSGADELYDMLPEDTQNLLSEKGVESMDANALLDKAIRHISENRARYPEYEPRKDIRNKVISNGGIILM